MVKKHIEELKRTRKDEKKERDYLLREFYELKNVFTLIKYAEEAKIQGQSEHIKPIIEEILKKIQTEERIDRRINRVYQRMREDIGEVEKLLAKSYPNVVQKMHSLLEKAEVFNADLLKLGSRGGQIEQNLHDSEKDPKKLNTAFSLIKRAFKDVQGFEEIVDELIHIDLYLIKQGNKLEDSDVTAELKKMVEADQAIRSGKKLKGIYANMMDVDKYNADRLKKILKYHKLTNPKDVRLAWFIVQHADHDPEFQERMLKELPLDKKQIKMKAYLIDRIRVNIGKYQYYGTQARNLGSFIALLAIEGAKVGQELEQNNLKFGPRTDESLKMINERRSSMGLKKVSKYFRGLKQQAAGGFFRSLFSRNNQPSGVIMWLNPKIGKEL